MENIDTAPRRRKIHIAMHNAQCRQRPTKLRTKLFRRKMERRTSPMGTIKQSKLVNTAPKLSRRKSVWQTIDCIKCIKTHSENGVKKIPNNFEIGENCFTFRCRGAMRRANKSSLNWDRVKQIMDCVKINRFSFDNYSHLINFIAALSLWTPKK